MNPSAGDLGGREAEAVGGGFRNSPGARLSDPAQAKAIRYGLYDLTRGHCLDALSGRLLLYRRTPRD